MYKEIRPGKVWYDTDGERIQAHGGSVLAVGGTFYWYGENKKGITGYAAGEYCGVWHHGVSLYSSKDLYNWKNEGVIMVDDENPDSPFYPKNIMDRPHIVYCERTGKFVLWAKCAGHGGFETAFFGVCESADIRGPYTYVRSVSCEPYHVGDFDLVVEDGRGYAIFEHPHTKMIVMELNDAFDDVTGVASEHLPRPFPPFTREAPAYFRRREERFLLTSGTTGYFPNPSEVCRITSFHGEWQDLGDPCVDDRNRDSFCAQFSSVFRHPTVPDLYIALGDRWLTDLSVHLPDIGHCFEQMFNPALGGLPKDIDLCAYTDSNTGEADYVWLPIRFRPDGTPYIEWLDRWRVEDFA